MNYCISKNGALLNKLKTPAFFKVVDDTEEFVNSLQCVQVVLNRLSEIRDPNTVDYLEGLLDGIRNTLDTYENLLESIEKEGRLIRFFTNSRRRKELDKLNSTLILQVTDLEFEVMSQERPSKNKGTIPQENEEVWEWLFGENTFVVTWPQFIEAISNLVALNQNAETVLKEIMDNSNTDSVNKFKFCEFLKGFGNIQDAVGRATKLWQSPYFYGYLSKEEAEKFLQTEDVGTYLLRFSSSKPGSFAIDYVGFDVGDSGTGERYGAMPVSQVGLESMPTTVKSVLVEGVPQGYKIKENFEGREKVHNNLNDLIQYYYGILVIPFVSSLPSKTWFHGDLSGEEAEQYLTGEKEGTFLLRFSSRPGCYASSFVKADGQIGKSLIKKTPDGFIVESSNDKRTYPGLDTLVKAYGKFFRYALSSEIILRKRSEQSEFQKTASTSFVPHINNSMESIPPYDYSVIESWTVDDVVQWLESIGLSTYKSGFLANKIDGNALLELSEDDMKRELNIGPLGHRKLIKKSLKKILDDHLDNRQ